MKKLIVCLLALMMLLSCAACGGQSDDTAADAPAETPDLQAYYDDFMAGLGADNQPAMTDAAADESLMEGFFPGLAAIERKQTVLQLASIGAVAFEFDLVECADAADVETVKGLFEDRVAMQIEGGAFYPETTAAWEKAEILVQGNVVALIVAGDQQSDAVDAFNALF